MDGISIGGVFSAETADSRAVLHQLRWQIRFHHRLRQRFWPVADVETAEDGSERVCRMLHGTSGFLYPFLLGIGHCRMLSNVFNEPT